MLVNFALDCIGTKISCDKVSSDGYEPNNLLCHGRGWHRSQGFLAEGFIKPPITVTLTFPCPVNLSHVVLDPQVGSQRSSTIEIYTAVRYRMQKLVTASPRQSATTGTVDRSGRGGVATENTSVTELEPIFKRVGSICCSEPGQICFDNPRYVSNLSSTERNIVGSHRYCSELRHHQWMMLSAVEFLAVRILHTVNGSVAAIGRLEVWGQPARSCPPQLREEVFQKYANAMGLQTQHSSSRNNQETGVKGGRKGVTCSSWNSQNTDTYSLTQDTVHVFNKGNRALTSGSTHLSLSHADQTAKTVVDIPEEFLDELTFEIMSIPMLLPSGHSIDVFTLDRFSDVEATYGRQPSDPFTGLVFTSTRQPVLNKPLKMRIDRFLSEHADEPSLQHVPRPLGHAGQSVQESNNTGEDRARSVDRKAGSSVQNAKHKLEDGLQRKGPQTCVQNTQHSFPPLTDAYTVSDVTPAKKKVKTEKETTLRHGKASTSGTLVGCSGSVTSSSGLTTTSSESHEERLRSSLSNSLSSVLRGLPSFTTPTVQDTSPGTVPSRPDQCNSCGTKLGQADAGTRTTKHSVAYMLPCKHLVCRVCLVATSNMNCVTCSMCQRQFARADVVRTHV